MSSLLFNWILWFNLLHAAAILFLTFASAPAPPCLHSNFSPGYKNSTSSNSPPLTSSWGLTSTLKLHNHVDHYFFQASFKLLGPNYLLWHHFLHSDKKKSNYVITWYLDLLSFSLTQLKAASLFAAHILRSYWNVLLYWKLG